MTEIVLQPDATAGVDAFIFQGAATSNYGNDIRLMTGESAVGYIARSLIKFDVSSIPSSATISTAILSLYYVTDSTVDTSTSSMAQKVHRVTAAWIEGQATWNVRATGTNWGTAGGDYDGTATATTNVAGKNAWYTWDIAADVQAWVAGAAANYGSIIIGNEVNAGSRKVYNSADYTTDTSLRPKLTITYTEAGSLLKVNMNAQMQSLNGGMHG